jgi:50S ribosomal subunit-associated GTPase HflX
MGLDGKPELLVFNKIDLVEPSMVSAMSWKYPSVAISALTGEGLEELSRRMEALLFPQDGDVRRIEGDEGEMEKIADRS